MSSVPGTSTANSQALASAMLSVRPVAAAIPVMPSPTTERSASNVSPSYSMSPRKAIGSSVSPSSSSR